MRKIATFGLCLALLLFPFVSLAQATPHSVALSWTASSDAAANPTLTYNVYRAPSACSASSSFTKLNTAAITAVTYTDSTVTVGSIYCYSVTAVLNSSESAKTAAQVSSTAIPVAGPTTIVIVIN